PALSAHLLPIGVDLVHECRDGHACAIALGLVQYHAQILTHPVDGETEIEAAFDHRATPVLHLPALRGALVDYVEPLVHVEPGSLTESNAFGQRLHQAGDADLVDHLGELACARITQQCHNLREIHCQWTD